MTVFWDTETFLITPGLQAPPPVVLQFAVDDGPVQLVHVRDPAFRRAVEWILTQPNSGHNIAFDWASLGGHFPDLMPAIFDCYRRDLVTDTLYRMQLIDIARGKSKMESFKGYSLQRCAERANAGHKDSADPFRVRYGTLRDVPISQWPQAALDYAQHDVEVQRAVHRWQEVDAHLLRDQYRQARGGWWLYLVQCWGSRTDLATVQSIHTEVLEQYEKDRQFLQSVTAPVTRYKTRVKQGVKHKEEYTSIEPFVKPDGKYNKAAAISYLLSRVADDDMFKKHCDRLYKQKIWVAGKTGKKPPPPSTPLDDDTLKMFGDETLLTYQRYVAGATRLNRIERLYYGTKYPLQCCYQPLLETGRTSCRLRDPDKGELRSVWGVMDQNWSRKGRVRTAFVSRTGVYAVFDYSGQECRTWSQACVWLVKRSSMAEVLNAKRCPHTELGALIANVSVEQAYALHKLGEFGGPRQSAKIGNFGFMCGMRGLTLVMQARQQYDQKMTLEEAESLRDAWMIRWPEGPEYLELADMLCKQGGGKADITQLMSERVRGRISYTVTANSFYQALAADANKAAGFEIARECYTVPESPLYGCRIVKFVHDEFVLEVPAHPELAHLAAQRLHDVACRVAQQWTPDVLMEGEVTLSRNWNKKAKPVWKDGMLTLWEEAA